MSSRFYRKFDSQTIYRNWANDETTLPVWHQPWWLDLTSRGDWSAVFLENSSGIVASIPFAHRSKFGLKILTQPSLSQCLGPWLKSEISDLELPEIQYKKLEELIKRIPTVISYQQNWSPEISNLVPQKISNFKCSTLYTYRINLLNHSTSLLNGLNENRLREIKKSQEINKIYTKITYDVDEIWAPILSTFERQGKELPYDKNILGEILKFGQDTNKSFGVIACDSNGNISASGIFVCDNVRTYYLAGGYLNPKSSNMTLVLWDAIHEAKNRGSKIFDFEGSMIPTIAGFFRSFGAIQTSYLKVWKNLI
jgi:hypothetical protein